MTQAEMTGIASTGKCGPCKAFPRVVLLVFLIVPLDAAKGHGIMPNGWDSTVCIP